MSSTCASAIDGFDRITDSISLHRPEASSKQRSISHEQPSLIVICSWMNAAEKHIAKYTAGYRRLYPDTTVLLVQCSLAGFFTSKAKQEVLLKPAYDMIINHRSDGNQGGPVVLHAFSNGGGTLANYIAGFLNERSPGKKVVFNKVILDCLPGIPTIAGAVRAVSFSLPRNPILRFLGQWIFRIWLVAYSIFAYALRRREDRVTRLRRRLNDPERFDLGAPRLYLYSKADDLVEHWAVAEHAEGARKKGYRVREEMFINAPHCAIAKDEPERYWKAVQEHIAGSSIK
ncbi:unnamed protein product [Zymoseptoria tritici ST99CH_3D7]|uniref:Indole-diterpene biosynthesis protein PaxU n=1 Tax=Zymoseptoria tritici (strain ST99CH_3D7) TaxID=1276538 RepID=A0A1X7RJQ1_ZYMT9|nr:unnamed protein product [Zymoseptoria tritici ST99CH_3D7]